MVRCIAYNDGYKYQLKQTHTVAIEIKPSKAIDIEYVALDCDGNLTMQKGYAWDGPSGPTLDTLSFMRGSLVHDALYQLMREECLDRNLHREAADRVLQRICIEDGMCRIRAWWVYHAVRICANPAADPASRRPVTLAPRGCEP